MGIHWKISIETYRVELKDWQLGMCRGWYGLREKWSDMKSEH